MRSSAAVAPSTPQRALSRCCSPELPPCSHMLRSEVYGRGQADKCSKRNGQETQQQMS